MIDRTIPSRGCGGVSINGPETDKLLVLAKHEEENERRKAVADPGLWPYEEDPARSQEDIADAKKARKARQISTERYYSDRAEYEAEECKLLKDCSDWQRRRQTGGGEPVDVATEWDCPGITLAEQRAYIEQALSAILVLSGGTCMRTTSAYVR
ncbi:hypothetical protein [Kitasatospora viridis]|uniref:hypothetical protein n=1 Tax=Kitasatospora viridis TaxID=281105 RepID=UPI0011A7600A|nr:hypothetical protein [Kitasatospora viridis]